MGYNPSYKWIYPTYPIYKWGYNSLTKWDEPPSSAFNKHVYFETCFAHSDVKFLCHLIRRDRSAPAALANLLFDPEPQTLDKRSVSRLFYLFAHLHLLSSDSFSSLTLPTSAFLSVHIVGSLTSKLPSIISRTYRCS